MFLLYLFNIVQRENDSQGVLQHRILNVVMKRI